MVHRVSEASSVTRTVYGNYLLWTVHSQSAQWNPPPLARPLGPMS